MNIMMILIRRLGLLIAILSAVIQPVVGQQNRTRTSVEFEYKLEVNSTKNGIEAAQEELNSWMSTIDSAIIPSLQERLPNGQAASNDELPNVKFDRSSSKVINQCFTRSDACQWIQSTISLTYEGHKPDFSLERATLGLVKEFLGSFIQDTTMVRVTYAYPMLASGSGRFELGPVNRTMDDVEIQVLETSFSNVFSAIVSAFDGDTEVEEAKFIYQDVTEQKIEGGELANVLSVDVMYFGRCRYCTNAQFVEMVDGVIYDPMTLEAFQSRLKYDGADLNTDYFENISFTKYSERETPVGTPGMEDESIYDSRAPQTSNRLPWYLWFAAGLVLVIICAGIYFIHRDQQELMKEENSTDEDDSSFEEDTNDRSSIEDSRGLDDEYTEEQDEAFAERASEMPSQDGPGESTVVSYNEERPTADGKQTQEYEIYVY